MSDDKNILEQANETVAQRAEEYGPPDENFQKAADLWSAYLGVPISKYDYAQMMLLAKVARTKTGDPGEDEELDKVGYAFTGDLVRQSMMEEGEWNDE
jgi:hypothetical protein